jgi:hypothetical protein
MEIDANAMRWHKSSYSQGNGECVEVGFLDAVAWRKSSYSQVNGECVEVALGARFVAVRDTKDGGRGPILAVSPDAWAAFVEAARAGEFGGG